MSTIDHDEVKKFSTIAHEWWNYDGKFKPLHRLNPLRIEYIRDNIIKHFNLSTDDYTPLEGLSLLDIGCGGGLITEPMARLGATVSAIDASNVNIEVASLHSKNSLLDILYYHQTVEEFALESENKFDIVLALEIVEHVANLDQFINACARLLKPKGIMFISTLNRTITSFLQSIIGAEYILNWLPKGTHNWSKFLLPSELAFHLRQNNLKPIEIKGITFSPLNNKWSLTDKINNNYIMTII